MEKEIKVRKKRFAAFWVAVLMVCGMAVPIAANAVENGVLTDSDTTLEAGIRIRADQIIYQYDEDNTLTSRQEESGGWQTIKKYADIENAVIEPGYEFDCWLVAGKSDNTLEYDSVKYPATVTLKARFKPKQVKITFVGTDIEPIMQEYGTAVEAPDEPKKAGYTFGGWDPKIPDTMPAEDLEITAKWTVNQYTITFDTDGGNEINPITVDYEAAVTPPTVPEKAGYTFSSWKPAIPEKMPAEDLTLTAQWTGNTYNINYIVGDGSKGENPDTYTNGTTVTLADAVKEGYSFAGWYSDEAFANQVTAISTTQTADITLYAKFESLPTVIEKGAHSLTAGVKYQLGSGVTRVDDDPSTYASGAYFYVPTDGSYTFN